MAAGREVWLDNLILRRIDPADLFAVPVAEGRRFSGDVVVRAALTVNTGGVGGVVCKLDSTTNPQNYVAAYISRDSNHGFALYKWVNGTPTLLIGTVNNIIGGTYRAGALLEIRASGTSFELWYDGFICGTSQTIADAAITAGTIHGMLSTSDAATIDAFGLMSSQTTLGVMAYVGGSITWTPSGWRHLTWDVTQQSNMGELLPAYNVAANGQTAWEHIIRMQTEVVDRGSTMVFVDLAANHANTDYHKALCEAYLRKLRAALPNATIIMPLFATWANGSATNPSNQLIVD